jgi:acetyl esterase/lipase
MMDDICRALVYVRDHINEHCPEADPNQIYLSGHSAGAHLISLLVLDRSHLFRHDLSLSLICGVIVMSGIYTLRNPTHDSQNNIRSWIFRILYSSNLIYPKGRNIVEYSPIEYINENNELPPFLVMSAKYDMGLEVDSKRFVEKLKKYHHQVEYFVVNGSHATIASKFSNNDAQKHFFTFIHQHMKY